MSSSIASYRGNLPQHFFGFSRDLRGLLNEMFGSGENGGEAVAFAPQMNVAETEKEYELTFDLPGLKPEEVKVEMQEGQLTVSGERKVEKEDEGKTWHTVERRYGSFRRSISLPTSVKDDEIDAEFKHGVLHVRLPKRPEVMPKQIQVKGG